MEIIKGVLPPCNNGPYIWDKSQHLEGIGSTFQWRKPSLIAAHMMSGKWVGNLTNKHHREDADQSTYFGLSYFHCDLNALKIYEKVRPEKFINMPEEFMLDYIPKIPANQITNTTVVVFQWEHLDESHNFAVFDDSFRRRFHEQRLHRLTPRRQSHEYWVSIHFRWGDVATKDQNRPNMRSGLGFSEYCACISHVLLANPHARIFVFAEEFARPDLCIVLKNKNVSFHNDSNTWKSDIDIMSQSKLLIGGSSSFFVLGAHLCENCTVIHNSQVKFTVSDYEKTLTSHLNPLFCNKNINCYLQQIERSVSSSMDQDYFWLH
jgi:hypothetical protein